MDVSLAIGNDGRVQFPTNPTYVRTLNSISDPKLRLLINGLAAMMRPVSLGVFVEKSSCIGTSRMMIEYLRRFGYEAEIISLTVQIWNPKSLKLLDKKRKQGIRSLNEFWKWAKANIQEYDASGSHLVSIGEPGPENVGHYGVYLPKYNLLLDATLDQANRPHKGIELKSFILSELPKGFKSGEMLFLEMHKCMIIYMTSTNENYKKAVDWTSNKDLMNISVDDMVKVITQTPSLFK